MLASQGLVRAQSNTTTRARLALWVAFLLGVAVSLAANVAAATLSWQQPVLVAGRPPLALLLAVELVVHSRGQDQTGRSSRGPRPHRPPNWNPETGAIESAETEAETAPETDRERTSDPAAATRPRRPGNDEELLTLARQVQDIIFHQIARVPRAGLVCMRFRAGDRADSQAVSPVRVASSPARWTKCATAAGGCRAAPVPNWIGAGR